jgi:hypothetical protein
MCGLDLFPVWQIDLSTAAPSMMKMEVAPVSAIAWLAAIVRALRNCSIGLPQSALTIAAIKDNALFVHTGFVDAQLEVIQWRYHHHHMMTF